MNIRKYIAGIVIGLALAAIVILGLPFTGTSVNPARSFGPALLVGGALAALVHRFVLTASEQ